MEGLKVMIELIDSSDGHYPLVYKIHKRFHISESLSKSYLCLLTLLFDNKEGESIKNKPCMDWNVVSVSLSSPLHRWWPRTPCGLFSHTGRWAPRSWRSSRTPGEPILRAVTAMLRWDVVMVYPLSLTLSAHFESTCSSICEIIRKSGNEKRVALMGLCET